LDRQPATKPQSKEDDTVSEGSCEGTPNLSMDDETVLYIVAAPTVTIMSVVTAPQLLLTLYKVKLLVEILMAEPDPSPSAIPSHALLGYEDLRALHYSCYLKDSKRLFDDQPNATYFRLLIELVSREFEDCTPLRNCWWLGYRSGDIVFYDLQGRENMGDFVSEAVGTSLFYWMQKTYDQFSHSGLLVVSGSVPRLFHGLSNRIKVLNYPLLSVYMPRRRIDFQKVYEGYTTLNPEVQLKILTLFTSAVHVRSANYSMYTNTSPGFWSGLWAIFGWRLGQVTTSPELLSKKSDPANPQAATPLCSGFTSAVLYEVLAEVGKTIIADYPELKAAMQFKSVMNRDVLNFTPKELHYWDVWEPNLPPHFFEKLVTPAVAASHNVLKVLP